ncbi:MAG: hemerythrin domain-containing protein [Sporichthyaceae bacterium]
MPSSITRLVRDDHERIPRLLHRVVSPGPSRQRWRTELVRLLRAHRAAEQELLTSDVVAPAGPAAVAAVHDLQHLDTELDAALRELDQVALDSVSLTGLGERLAAVLDRHAGLTDDVLRPLEDAVPRKQLRLLGGAYSQVREDLLHDEGAAEPPPRRLDLPRAELYELARRAGIEGRSAMSRGQLISALQRGREPAPS